MPEPQINTAGYHAALEALIMDDPHAGGCLGGSPMHRLERALYAYEWARQRFPIGEDGRQVLPMIGLAREAVLMKERAEKPLER